MYLWTRSSSDSSFLIFGASLSAKDIFDSLNIENAMVAIAADRSSAKPYIINESKRKKKELSIKYLQQMQYNYS